VASIRVAAVAAHFRRELDFDLERIAGIIGDAREAGVSLLVLPDAALGGYLIGFGRTDDLPCVLSPDGAEISSLIAAAGDLVVCVGYCEGDGDVRYNAAICLWGGGVLGRHRKVHQPAGERGVYTAGDRFEAFDTPLGRLGMLIDYDKTFPEGARKLALDGARVLACLSAWPASVTNRAPRLTEDRQTRLFDLYDQARAAENQVVLVSANQTGTSGEFRFLGRAKVVGPGGEVLARTGSKAGLAVATVDPVADIDRARRVLDHLRERRPDTYGGYVG
jgi:predicted amidohydrolase